MALINYPDINNAIKILQQADGVYRFAGLEYKDEEGNWLPCEFEIHGPNGFKPLITSNNPKENDPTS